MKATFSDLYEDEISGLLREYSNRRHIIRAGYMTWMKSASCCLDGMQDDGNDLYIEYIDISPVSSYVNRNYLVLYLSHKEFTITTEENEK